MVLRRRLISDLRRARARAGLTGTEVAKAVGWSTSKISRLESGQTLPHKGDITTLLDLYAVPEPKRTLLLELVDLGSEPSWWDSYSDLITEGYSTYVGFEEAAARIYEWESMVIPGLLQTEDYARAIAAPWKDLMAHTPRQAERGIALRMERQKILTRAEPVQYKTILDESVLRRTVGDKSIMREQLASLRRSCERPNVHIGIMLHERAIPFVAFSFSVLEFPEIGDLGELHPEVAYSEDIRGGVIEEDEFQTYRYRRIFDQLYEAALTREESRDFITEMEQRAAVS